MSYKHREYEHPSNLSSMKMHMQANGKNNSMAQWNNIIIERKSREKGQNSKIPEADMKNTGFHNFCKCKQTSFIDEMSFKRRSAL